MSDDVDVENSTVTQNVENQSEDSSCGETENNSSREGKQAWDEDTDEEQEDDGNKKDNDKKDENDRENSKRGKRNKDSKENFGKENKTVRGENDKEEHHHHHYHHHKKNDSRRDLKIEIPPEDNTNNRFQISAGTPKTPQTIRRLHFPPAPVVTLNPNMLPAFALQPVPFSTLLQCRIIRKKTMFSTSFEMRLEKENVFLMAAHRVGHASNYHIATTPEGSVAKTSPLYVGKVEKQSMGDVFVLFGRGENYRKQKGGYDKTSPAAEQRTVVVASPVPRSPDSLSRHSTSSGGVRHSPLRNKSPLSRGSREMREEMDRENGREENFDPFAASAIEGRGDQRYDCRDRDWETEREGRSVPTNEGQFQFPFREHLALITFTKLDEFVMTLNIHIPQVSQSGQRQRICPTRLSEDIISLRDTAPLALCQLISRRPVANSKTGRLQMDFGGRAPIPSIKNQQIIIGSNPDLVIEQRPNSLQFGKMDEDHFSLDFSWPFCPLQAFAIALIIFLKR